MKKIIGISIVLSILIAYPTTLVLAQPSSNDMNRHDDMENDDDNGKWGLLGLLGLLGLVGLKKKEHTSRYTTSATPKIVEHV